MLTVHLRVPQLTMSSGFRAVYSVEESACGGSLIAEQGHFASPGYPNAYPQNAECIWTLGEWPGNKLTLSFQFFNLETSDGCNRDYVEIHEINEEGRLLLHTCGDNIPASNITANSKLWVKFNSDAQGVSSGFTAFYSIVYEVNEITGNSGSIVTPLYPSAFIPIPGHSDPSWRITVDSGSTVMIQFSTFEIEMQSMSGHYQVANGHCLATFLIYDGFDESAPELLRQCGTELPNSVTSSGNGLFIKLNLPSNIGDIIVS